MSVAVSQSQETLFDIFSRSFSNYRDRPCFGVCESKSNGGTGEYEFKTYQDISVEVRTFARGLVHLGLRPCYDFIGIYAKNSPAWLVTALAGCEQSLTIVPLYNASGPNSLKIIVRKTKVATIVCSTAQIPALLESCGDLEIIKTIIAIDHVDQSHIEAAEREGIKIVTWAHVIKIGKSVDYKDTPPEPGFLYMIMFTSGEPKGVQLTHGNVVASMAGLSRVFGLLPSDLHFSYLPLAHIFEHMACLYSLASGAAIGFGSSIRFSEDLKKLKPTILVGVPLVFNRLQSSVQGALNRSNFIQRIVFNYGFNAKQKATFKASDSPAEPAGSSPPEETPFWNRHVFNRLKASMGMQRVRLLISAAAPLSPEVMTFLRVCFCPIVQVYGMTEAGGPISCTSVSDYKQPWSHGHPVSTLDLKLADVPEMDYFATANPPTGEICIKGPAIFQGYYKDNAQTAQAFDSNGYFHTGDIARKNPDGSISLIDRKKNIFKLSQGEYIAAEYLENVYGRSKFVHQIFIYGDSLKSFLVAILVLKEKHTFSWAKEANIDARDIVTLCRHPAVKRRVFDDLLKLQSFEIIKNIQLEPEPWTLENELLSPTLRLNRVLLKKKYADMIEVLYHQPKMVDDSSLKPKL